MLVIIYDVIKLMNGKWPEHTGLILEECMNDKLTEFHPKFMDKQNKIIHLTYLHALFVILVDFICIN